MILKLLSDQLHYRKNPRLNTAHKLFLQVVLSIKTIHRRQCEKLSGRQLKIDDMYIFQWAFNPDVYMCVINHMYTVLFSLQYVFAT